MSVLPWAVSRLTNSRPSPRRLSDTGFSAKRRVAVLKETMLKRSPSPR